MRRLPGGASDAGLRETAGLVSGLAERKARLCIGKAAAGLGVGQAGACQP